MFKEIIYKKKEKEQKLYFIAQTIAKKTIEYAKEIIKPGLNLIELRKCAKTKCLNLGQILFGTMVLVRLYLQAMKLFNLFQEKNI